MERTMVHRVTLGTGKVVLLRDLMIKHQDLAISAASRRVSSDNKAELAVAMQKELIKLLVVQIDSKQPTAIEMENLDGVFTYGEYMQLVQVLEKLTGGFSEMGNFQIEMLPSGGT